MTDARSPFSPGVVWTASAREQFSYLIARFGPQGTWSVRSQSIVMNDADVPLERVEIVHADGRIAVVEFAAIGDQDDLSGPGDDDRTQFLDDVMRSAATFSESNPPHHPGTIARFPVPSAAYVGALAVPLPILAISDGARGLFAPPRVVVMDFPGLTLVGVGEFQGFDPESWPPARLGDWPPALARPLPAEQLQATIERYSASWFRVLDSWFAKTTPAPDWLAADIVESCALRQFLDGGLLETTYARLNPEFARWLERGARVT